MSFDPGVFDPGVDPIVLWAMFKQYLLLSVLSIGGANTALSEFHRFLVLDQGWLSEQRFVELYALSQAAPGPNVLFVALFGLQIAGLAGLVVSMVGICTLPAVIALGVERLSQQPRIAPTLKLLRRSLAATTVGLVIATGIVLARTADTGWLPALLTAGTLFMLLKLRWHPLAAIAIGAVVGAVGMR